jgi:hypothetical protein
MIIIMAVIIIKQFHITAKQFISIVLLGALTESRKAPITFVMSFVRLSARMYGFPLNFIMRTFMKIGREIPNLVKIEKSIGKFT